MDTVDIYHNESSFNNKSEKQSFSEEAPGISDVSRDPELLPRIGRQYQVEIPPLMTKSAYMLLSGSPTDGVVPSTMNEFLVGLPLSLMWIGEEFEIVEMESPESSADLIRAPHRSESIKAGTDSEIQISPIGDFRPKVEQMEITVVGGIDRGDSAGLHFRHGQGLKTEMYQNCGGKGYCMVPGSLAETWTDSEEAAFILGLYIFGKNLVQVKEFVETKRMGDILTFYYGKFYRSDRYRRWSECRKIRSRRSIYGQRIFTGLRQQELLSRLLPHLSEERQMALLEVAQKFGEGKMLLEEYVSALKAKVGLGSLVEAVAIGKGKKDLTGFAMEPCKSTQVSPVCPEIPMGKACSKLTDTEIINFLTGGYRLSKARSNDLFWEAVWPRLLARGWHSEQPNDYGFAGASRNSLVFLVPGIKKFSRRKLMKGTHYFDSVTDVLNKVASEPSLLELDIGPEGYNCNKENGWTNETNFHQGDFPDQQCHCDMKPRASSRLKDVAKFTVVDTSLANGETTKVRELRSLPAEIVNISSSSTDPEESDDDSSEEQLFDDFDFSDLPCIDGNQMQIFRSIELKLDKRDKEELENNFSDHRVLLPAKKLEGLGAEKYNDMQQTQAAKGHATRRTKSGDKFRFSPDAQPQQIFTARDSAETSSGAINLLISSGSKQDEPSYSAANQDFIFHADPREKPSSSLSSSMGSPNISDECGTSDKPSGAENPEGRNQTRMLIDLNLPVLQDTETEPLMIDLTERLSDRTSRRSEELNTVETSIPVSDSTAEQPYNMNSRRHSTRNRPPTTKALEAVAFGFLGTKQKRKNREDFLLENSISRHSPRARIRVTKKFRSGIEDLKEQGRGNGACNN